MRKFHLLALPLLRIHFQIEKMIWIILIYVGCIFAEDLRSEIVENDLDTKYYGLEKRDFLGEPRFNASCDSDSLDAAGLCEERL